MIYDDVIMRNVAYMRGCGVCCGANVVVVYVVEAVVVDCGVDIVLVDVVGADVDADDADVIEVDAVVSFAGALCMVTILLLMCVAILMGLMCIGV